jgi:tRNA1Val (adenine37-N6)-methyltransferase
MNPFHFKKFSIRQSSNVFKVGTDGLLLGAWTNVDNAQNLLDVGTGTGIVALMCTQRNPHLCITAIDINADAVELAKQNFKNSPWNENATIMHTSIENLMCSTLEKFDVIVSNPPYFIESTPAKNQHIHKAKHQVEFSIETLIGASVSLLNENGNLNIIYPSTHAAELMQLSEKYKLFLKRRTTVYSKVGKQPERELLSFGFEKGEVDQDALVIQYENRNDYTETYKNLTNIYHTIF